MSHDSEHWSQPRRLETGCHSCIFSHVTRCSYSGLTAMATARRNPTLQSVFRCFFRYAIVVLNWLLGDFRLARNTSLAFRTPLPTMTPPRYQHNIMSRMATANAIFRSGGSNFISLPLPSFPSRPLIRKKILFSLGVWIPPKPPLVRHRCLRLAAMSRSRGYNIIESSFESLNFLLDEMCQG